MGDIYREWKPLRNFLGKVDPKEALEVLRYYSLFSGDIQTLPPSPPDYIEVHDEIFKVNNGVLPWDVETLAREVIYAADDNYIARYSFRKWKDFSKAMNLLKSIENTIAETEINQSNIWREMFRLSHRQFPHQLDHLSRPTMIRYATLFSHAEVEPLLVNKLGLSAKKIITIGISLWGQFQTYAAIYKPYSGWPKLGITLKDLELFLKFMSMKYDDLQKLIKSNHKIDNTFFYKYNPITQAPLVEILRDNQVSYICPSVNKFQSRITRGLYYELFMINAFGNAFGNAFEQYIGEVLIKSTKKSKTKIYGEETDPHDFKKRCDWIIDQPKSFTIIECKTKRMAIDAYTVLDDDTALIAQLTKLAEAVVQAYQAFIIYDTVGYSPQVYPYNPKKDGSICVVTLEKWYIYGAQLVRLREIVRQLLINKSIDPKLMEKVPFAIIGSDELEKLAFLASRNHSIRDMIVEHSDTKSETSTWEFSVQINHQHKEALEHYDYIFSDKFDEIFTLEIQQLFKANDTI